MMLMFNVWPGSFVVIESSAKTAISLATALSLDQRVLRKVWTTGRGILSLRISILHRGSLQPLWEHVWFHLLTCQTTESSKTIPTLEVCEERPPSATRNIHYGTVWASISSRKREPMVDWFHEDPANGPWLIKLLNFLARRHPPTRMLEEL